MNPIEYLDLEDLIDLATMLLGPLPPIRDIGLLGAAAFRPQTTAFGEDAYPELWSKAAALLQSIVKNHALVDGNKRLGWLSTAAFLELNGIAAVTMPNDVVFEFVMRVAAGDHGVEELASQLRSLLPT